jgi:hypothetical protein
MDSHESCVGIPDAPVGFPRKPRLGRTTGAAAEHSFAIQLQEEIVWAHCHSKHEAECRERSSSQKSSNRFFNSHFSGRLARLRNSNLLHRAELQLRSLPTPGVCAFPYRLTVQHTANPFRTATAPLEPISKMRTVRGVPGVHEKAHDNRCEGKRERKSGQTAVQKRYKLEGGHVGS